MNSIGDIHLKQNLENKAIPWCEEGLEIADEIGAIPEQIAACNCLYEAYKLLGKGNDALIYFERVKTLEDSISKEETWKKLQKMEFEKQIQIEITEREKEEQRARSRLWIIVLIALGATITPIILYYYYKQRIRLHAEKARSHLSNHLLAEEKLKTRNQEKQLLDLELEHKKKDLADMALSLSQKKQQAEELCSRVNRIENSKGKQRQKEFRDLKEELQNQRYVDKEMEHLQQNIDTLSNAFYNKLQTSFPELSKTEVKLSSLIKLNLSTSQIAQLQNITPKSVNMSRYRLKKKLGLDNDQNLDEFLQSF
jgi:DNA-binding CsgD family transcriptional regulator